MKKAVLLALMCLVPATASAQDGEDTYSLRWTLAAGPSVAAAGRSKLNLTGIVGCTTCGRVSQRVIGADESKFHAYMNVAGDIKFDITIRGEFMYNHSESPFRKSPPRYCFTPYKCFQDRVALKDDIYYMGGGVEFAPTKSLIQLPEVRNFFDKVPLEPYLVVTGGLSLSKLRFNWDTTGTSTAIDQHAQGFGSYVGGGAGLRVRAKSVLMCAETRRFQNFANAGRSMASFSFGLQYWLHFRNYGY